MRKIRKKKILLSILIIAIVITAGVIAFSLYGSYKISKIPAMSFEDVLNYTTKNNKDAVITVGIIQNGTMSYDVYGENGIKLPQQEHIYEIGSITKTFTTSLLCKAISEGKVGLDNTIDEYLILPNKDYYPTIKRLVTHTSGYKGHYFEKPMISNFLSGKNDFNGVTGEMLIKRLGKVDLDDSDYSFRYSNFGIASLGAVLEQIYDNDFETLMNSYIADDLRLLNTKISDGTGDLKNYWEWSQKDAYMPAGALVSNITDMMIYVQMQMACNPEYLSMAHDKLAEVNASTESYKKLGIRIDSVGMGWMLDEENNIIWHNGATDDFNSYIGFDKEKQIGVVILSNLPPDYRIPATIMGVKLMTSLQSK